MTRPQPEQEPEQDQEQERIAVIGMAGRFPGAEDVAALWRNLRAGVESIRRFSATELEAEGVPADLLADPRYIPAKGVLDGIESFDAEFFGFPPREAELLDPQQRLFLECAWQVCESAGYDPQTYPGRIGVYAGAGYSSYMTNQLLANPERLAGSDGLQLRLLNDKDFLATHVSYKLDLRGPSITVQTACSTSLVAAHLACQSLLEGECDMALAGGVTVSFPHRTGYLFTEGGILSSDGHCRAFDARADGTVEGNGAGAVLLKRLSDAVADGDTILAVIRGSAVNNDGALKAGYTAPSAEGQTRVVAEALAMAGVAADSIRYVETHGSGTPLGDPIEVEALTRAFRSGGARRQGFCALGSIKTNFGHTDCAAGVAGLIKTVSALRHRQIPPSLGCEQPNPRLGLASSPFYISTELHDWPANGSGPRRAGVNSLGIGGTNAHMVLEEAPPSPAPSPSRPWQLLLLSARTPAALAAARENLARHLASPEGEEQDLADVAHTLRAGRRGFRYRAAVVCRDRPEAVSSLTAPGVQDFDSESPGGSSAAFLFPGLGDHAVGMAAGLYQQEPVFRRAIDTTAGLLMPHLGQGISDIRDVIWPAGDKTAAKTTSAGPDLRRLLAQPAPEDEDEATRRLNRTAFAHPAVFAVEHALATLWMDWGVQPAAMLGYSLGEYVAACLAGVFPLAGALELVALRARLIDALPAGAMLAVPLPAAEVEAVLQGLPDLWLGAANGPGLSVVSGTLEAVAELERRLGSRSVSCRRLQTTHAFHCPLMEPIVAELTRCAAGLALAPPKIPLISNVTGTWITPGEATDPAYWARHLCRPVRFAEGLETLLGGEPLLLIEAGPGQTLGTLARQHPVRRPGQVAVASLRDRREEGSDQAFLLAALGRLWQAGVAPRWDRFAAGEKRRRVPLPTYPFERRRYFIEPAAPGIALAAPAVHRGFEDWFSVPSWERAPLAMAPIATPPQRWLLLLDSTEPEALGPQLAACLEARGDTVQQVAFSSSLDYQSLLQGAAFDRIVHLCSLRSDSIQETGFDSLLALAQALGGTARSGPLHLTVVTSGLHDVIGGETLLPEKATLLGPCRVLPQEVPGVTCSVIDVTTDATDLAEPLVAELLAPMPAPGSPAAVLALRGRHRWTQSFRPAQLPSPAPGRLRQGGVCLITDGLGETGLTLAEHLFRTLGARLALLAASGAPPRDEWAEWLGAHDAEEPLARRLRRALALEAAGCELLVLPVDLARPEKIETAVARVRERFSSLHGVVHIAGEADSGAMHMMQWTSREAAAAALAPALRGTLALAAATRDLPLDLFVLFASNTLATGGLGQITTTAVGSFLAAFAAAREGRAPFTQAIGWDLFRWQPVSVADPNLAAALQAGIEEIGITSDAFTTAFDRLLASPFPQVVVATRDLATVAMQLDPAAIAPVESAAPATAHPRPALEVPYTAPASDSERLIARIWGEAFGIDQVGVHDNFFSLAGSSLLALQIVTRLSGAFGVDVPMVALLESPTVAELAQRIDGLVSPARADSPQSAADPAAAAIIPRRQEADVYPLSVDQERLWFVQQLDRESPIYNIYSARRCRGRIAVPALVRALNESVRRHEVLRTSFPALDGKPVQQIAPRMEAVIPVFDLRALPAARREPEAARIAAVTVRMPFYIDRLPLFRTLLIQVDDEEFIWPIVIHHLVTDWISYYALEGELTTLYLAFAAGRPSPLPEPTLQFADFAVWQRRRLLDGGGLEAQLDYWRRHLAGAPELLPLPTDRPRPPVQTPWGARRRLALSLGQSAVLRSYARQQEVTLFTAVLAVFKALLVRVSGQEKLIVGTPLAYRQGPELQNVPGFFLNQIALYTDLTGDPPFQEVLARVRETALAAYANQDLPFARLVEALRLERDLSHTPLTQVVLLLLNPEEQTRQTAGGPNEPGDTGYEIESEPYWVDAQRTQFDITFSLWEDAGLEGWMEYNVDLFDATTIDRLKESFRILLAGALENPERRLWDLPLISAAQRQQLLAEWSGAGAETPAGDLCLHQLFAARAAAAPESPAIVWDGGRLSYGEVAERAALLADRLAALGVGPDRLVALVLPRGPALVIGLLATLQAGGAYLPLNAATPAERVEAILADARPVAVITEDGTSTDKRTDRNTKGDAEQLAYVIYTSGSTGRPNGVLVRHRSIVERILAAQAFCGIGPASRVLQVASPGFDASVLETWLALASGACLIIPSEEARSGPALAEVIRRERVSWMILTPAALAAVPEEDLPSLRSLAVGGESCPAEVANRWSTGRDLLNLYGPTEATIYATLHRCSGTYHREPPIGRPVDGVRAYVLDPYGGLAPEGVAGELCLAGRGLARGYLGRPELTAERFAPDPFGGAAGARLYHTGDLARFRADGVLEFLGRADRQVKIRGIRIELGEIEAALATQPAVREAVVLARPFRSALRLVAYVVLSDATADLNAVDAIKTALRRRLPDAMMPAAWVVLPALPLTAQGKIDRRALPEPEMPTGAAAQTPPANAVEAALAEVVAGVLGLPRVGVHDNFFALGGDSILSIQVVTQARRLGIALTPTQLFQQQTVAQMATVATMATTAGTLLETKIEEEPGSGAVPLTPVQRWFFAEVVDREPGAAHHFNLSLLLAAPERLDPARLAAALALLTRRHDALRLRFRRGPEGWEQWTEAPGVAAPDLPVIDLSRLAPDARPGALAAAAAQAQGSLDLTNGPLQRAIVCDLGPGQEGRLLWVMHHLLVDAVSWRVLVEDLAAASASQDLPPRTTSFKRWAELLAAHAASPALTAELPFWQGLPWTEAAPIPRDFGSPTAGTVASERAVTFELDEAETRALLEEVPRAYGTRIQEVLLTAVARAFAGWAASPVLLLDLEGHGREEISAAADLTRTVGWLTNVYPVVLDLRAGTDPASALKAVKEQVRRVPGGGLGYGLLRETALAGLPKPEVSFNYLGQIGPIGPIGQGPIAQEEAPAFSLAPEESGPQRDRRLPRLHLLAIEGSIAGGRLSLSCLYSAEAHRPATAGKLLADLGAALRELIDHCRRPEAGGFTPSDFLAARLSQTQIDRLVDRLGGHRSTLEDVYELSPMQREMLAQTLRSPGSGVYCVQLHGRLSGPLDRAAFARAWAAVIDRHPVLRTAFHWRELEKPVQTVWRQASLSLHQDDWRGLPAAEQAKRLEDFLLADRQRGFALDRAPLLRIAVFHAGPDSWRFVLSVHHLLLDGWCVSLIFTEVLAFYAAYSSDGEAPRLGHPRPYRDYILWLQQQGSGEVDLRDGADQGESQPASEQADRELSAPLTAALEGLARRHRLTLNTLVQGAWALLLARVSGQRDVLFGTTVAGRPPELAGSESMIGLFINILPLRVEVEPEMPLVDWLRRLQERYVAARENEHVPVGAHLFESVLAFENYPRGTQSSGEEGDFALDELETVDFNHHPLTLVAVPGERLLLRLAYAPTRFTAESAARILEQLVGLLAGMSEETWP
ncbi:MAG TPA: amino acid adenylation domain-containing protein [Thermoanaerobaculia bacterium]|nr:amino acid adenylation domain-containing protein [Thermoanaerobaculia bacterium]